jgi:hypothetical protein
MVAAAPLICALPMPAEAASTAIDIARTDLEVRLLIPGWQRGRSSLQQRLSAISLPVYGAHWSRQSVSSSRPSTMPQRIICGPMLNRASMLIDAVVELMRTSSTTPAH